MKILVLRGGALGDLIVTIPALRALRTRYPDAEIHLVGNLPAALLLVECGVIDGAYSQHESRWASLYSEGPLPEPTVSFFNRFEIVVSFWNDPDRTLARHLEAGQWTFVRSDARIESEPASRHFCAALSALGITGSSVTPRIEVGEVARAHGRDALGVNKPTLAVHVGSGSPKKSWPLNSWKELCSRMECRILWITGEAESPDLQPPSGLDLLPARNWPLTTLAGALTHCVHYVGHDTGISHLAAAVGTPCTLLFGPTDPRIWAPPGDQVQVLRNTTDITSLTVEQVFHALSISAPSLCIPTTDGIKRRR